MQGHKLTVQKRNLTGRKVKKLRKEGIIPGNIFGKGVKSLSVQVGKKDFFPVLKKAGETGIVELSVEGESGKRPILITNVQYGPASGFILHADFHQVDLKEKVTAKVPLAIAGESPAVRDQLGALLTPVDEIEVEALPMDLPEEIAVDIGGLAELDQELKVKDLSVDTGKVTIKADPELVIAKIGPLISKEAEEQAKADAAAQAATATPAPGEVIEAPKEGEAKPPVSTAEEKKE